jgi:hypothetical protein
MAIKAYITGSGSSGSSGPVNASQVIVDDTHCNLGVNNAQDYFEELCSQINTSASPGFDYGAPGSYTSGDWLLAQGVPSNTSGRLVSFSGAQLRKVEVASPTVSTFTMEIWEHAGNLVAATLLATIVVTAASSGSASFTANITTGKRLGVKVVSGTAQNCNVGLFLSGSY